MEEKQTCRRCHGTGRIKFVVNSETLSQECLFCKFPLPLSEDEEETKDRYFPEVEFSIPFDEKVINNPEFFAAPIAKIYRDILENREEIVRAFIAETGCLPTEAVQMKHVQHTSKGFRIEWWIERKTETMKENPADLQPIDENTQEKSENVRKELGEFRKQFNETLERPKISVSEWCAKTCEKLCHICDDILCGDNLNPFAKKLEEIYSAKYDWGYSDGHSKGYSEGFEDGIVASRNQQRARRELEKDPKQKEVGE